MKQPLADSFREIRIVDRILFVIIAAILCARPLISEAFARASFSFLPDAVGGVSPVITIRLDGVLMIAACAAWIRRPPAKLLTPVGVGYVLLLGSVIISTMFADSKRVALNAGADLFVLAWAAGGLARVMRARWMVRLLLAAIIAGGATNAVKCINQHMDEFGATLDVWMEQKADLEAAGVDVNSPNIVNYERRLRSGETFGFLSHPNIAAACLTPPLLLVIGLLGGVVRKSGFDLNSRVAAGLVACILAGVLVTGIYLTGSMGAFASGAAGVLLLILLGAVWKLVVKHQRAVFTMLIGVYVAVIALGAGYGALKNTLPHDSLAFRWQYWRVAAAVYADMPWTGVGRENFRAAYLMHKPPESTEEVANAHNLWLTLSAELGTFGLIAGVVLLGAVFRRSLNTFGGAEEVAPCVPGRILPWLIAFGVLGVQAWHYPLPLSAPGVFVLWSVFVAGVWIAAFLLSRMLLSLVDASEETSAWLSAGLIGATAAILIHNLIGFSLFTPAGLSTLAVLAAAAYAWRPPQISTKPRRGVVTFIAAALLLAAAYIAGVAWPTVRTDNRLRELNTRLTTSTSPETLIGVLDHAYGEYNPSKRHWDATIPAWAASVARQYAESSPIPAEQRGRWLALAAAWTAEAVRCEPGSFLYVREQAEITRLLSRMKGDVTLLRSTEALWRVCVIRLNPTDPRTRIAAADLEYELWKSTGEPAYADYARHNYSTAMKIDALYKLEVAHKLPAGEAQRVRGRIEELR